MAQTYHQIDQGIALAEHHEPMARYFNIPSHTEINTDTKVIYAQALRH